MDDSFLADLELIPTNEKQSTSHPVDRHVTTRAVTSSPLQTVAETKLERYIQRRSEPLKQSSKDLGEEARKLPDSKKQSVKLKVPEKRERPIETKLRPLENKVRSESRESIPKVDSRARLHDTKIRISDPKTIAKERARRSGSYKENTPSSDVSTKENSRPSDSTKDGASQVDATKDKAKKSDCSRRSDVREKDPVALLNAIKDLVSSYTKQESTKILRAMQELHMNSQANLVKGLLCQTEDLVKEIRWNKNTSNVKTLVQRNSRLEDDLFFLKQQNEELRRKNEELQKGFEVLKQENMTLKLRCKDLPK